MNDPLDPLRGALGASASWLDEQLAECQRDPKALFVAFPQLPRRVSRQGLGLGPSTLGPARCDLAAWRQCDAAAALLLARTRAPGSAWLDLYAHGDLEERAMLLRSLAVLPIGEATGKLLLEVQRTNMVVHLEAAVCDSDLLVRVAKASLPGFGKPDVDRLLLKLAFLDLPLSRVFSAETLANAELSRMLADLATEREAAGRPVWRDTDRMLARAPVAGTVARLLGGLEHGDDNRRRAAAEGLLALNRKDLRPFAEERLPREPRADVQDLLRRLCR